MTSIQMTSIQWIGVVFVLAAVAILLRYRARHPKRADKWEKTEIMKQLLAKSELETGVSPSQASVRSQKPAAQSKRSGKIPPKPTTMSAARTRRQA
jgi:hypothetical protein